MDSQIIRNIQQNMANSTVRPLYADEVLVAHTLKTGKDNNGKTVKEATLQLVFIDMTTQRPTDKVCISPITAMGLQKALGESLAKIERELKGKNVEKVKKVETDYIR